MNACWLPLPGKNHWKPGKKSYKQDIYDITGYT